MDRRKNSSDERWEFEIEFPIHNKQIAYSIYSLLRGYAEVHSEATKGIAWGEGSSYWLQHCFMKLKQKIPDVKIYYRIK